VKYDEILSHDKDVLYVILSLSHLILRFLTKSTIKKNDSKSTTIAH